MNNSFFNNRLNRTLLLVIIFLTIVIKNFINQKIHQDCVSKHEGQIISSLQKCNLLSCGATLENGDQVTYSRSNWGDEKRGQSYKCF
jgi:hypothetical protein